MPKLPTALPVDYVDCIYYKADSLDPIKAELYAAVW